MNVELTVTGAGLIAGLLAAWRLVRRGKWRPPVFGQQELRQILQAELRQHCPEEQKRMTQNLSEVIRQVVTEQTRDLIEWRGAVDARLQHSNGHDARLHKRMDRLEDAMRKEIDGLRNALVEWMRGNRREGP